MVARGLLALALPVALAGCDAVFGVDPLYECPSNDDDCDKLLDAVDPCPGDPGNADDQDGDGVGDDCDPNVATPIDALLEFDGLKTNDGRWNPRGSGAFDMYDSALVLTGGAVERTVSTNRQPTVEIVLDEPIFAGEGSTVGAFVASKSATGVPLECRVEHTANGDDLVVLVGDPASGPPAEVGRAKQIPGAGAGERLRIYGGQLTNFSVRCRARYGDNDALFVDWSFFTSPADFDTVGFRVNFASATYRSVTIFTTP